MLCTHAHAHAHTHMHVHTHAPPSWAQSEPSLPIHFSFLTVLPAQMTQMAPRTLSFFLQRQREGVFSFESVLLLLLRYLCPSACTEAMTPATFALQRGEVIVHRALPGFRVSLPGSPPPPESTSNYSGERPPQHLRWSQRQKVPR